MANSYLDQAKEATYRRMRGWVLGVSLSAMAILGAGLWLALTDGVARPWAGLGFALSMGLAIVVGASKTSSA